MKQFKTKIIANKKIAQDHYVLSFKIEERTCKVKTGQFFNIRVNNSYEPLLRRPFGIHKIGKNEITILYKVVGKATELLSKKEKGSELDILGPLGNGFSVEQSNSAILVAGGHGVAPLYALAKQMANRKSEVTVFLGAKTKKHIICDSAFRKLGAKVYISTEDGRKGRKGLITELLREKLQSTLCNLQSVIYACGPKPMLKETAKLAKHYKIPCQVSLEEYVACGVGTCLGCAVKTRIGYKMICKDGPVFDAKEIVWQT